MTPLEAIVSTITNKAPTWKQMIGYGADVIDFVQSQTFAGPTVMISVGHHEPVGQPREGGRYRGFSETFTIYLRAPSHVASVADTQKTFLALRDAFNGMQIDKPEGGPAVIKIAGGIPLYNAGLPEAQLVLIAD